PLFDNVQESDGSPDGKTENKGQSQFGGYGGCARLDSRNPGVGEQEEDDGDHEGSDPDLGPEHRALLTAEEASAQQPGNIEQEAHHGAELGPPGNLDPAPRCGNPEIAEAQSLQLWHHTLPKVVQGLCIFDPTGHDLALHLSQKAQSWKGETKPEKFILQCVTQARERCLILRSLPRRGRRRGGFELLD